MNNIKVYKILYYLLVVITATLIILVNSELSKVYVALSSTNIFLGILNVILIGAFSFLLKKKNLYDINITVPIIYLLFMLIIVIISIMYNSKLIIPTIQYNYYLSFILFGYFFINVYSLLCLTKK